MVNVATLGVSMYLFCLIFDKKDTCYEGEADLCGGVLGWRVYMGRW